MIDCIFCKIVKGEIPSTKIYEDQLIIALLDIAPANKGHCLVMPKNHYETLLDLPEEDLSDLFFVAKKVSKAISLALGNKGYNILMNNDKTAGQLVPHAHVHVIPRFKGDRVNLGWRHKRYVGKEMEKIKEKIVKFL
ncbi:HIT family protein [Candidatus Woesearchaeota archaeon]|nr:HIT family protein [Candidatus Woesearchaeota archaeon]